MDETAIPKKLPAERIEFAVVLFSGGNMSDTIEYANGSTEELIVPCKNLNAHRSAKDGIVPAPI